MEDQERAKEQAQAQFNSIKDLIEQFRKDVDDESVRYQIEESPLSLEIRSSWQTVGEELTPDEYLILLCTGGPAVRITGYLDEYGQPIDAAIQYQDWFTEWKTLDLNTDDQKILEEYTGLFYFGG